MIEFNGYLSGEAEKFFWKHSRRTVLLILYLTFLIMLPIFLIISINTNYWKLLDVYIAFCLTTPLFLFIPKTKKEKEKLTLKRIFVEGEYIVCQKNKDEDYRLIEDTEKVIDYGTFYYIHFPFGKKSENFICQKDLLTKGTLEEFESLFEGKIIRKATR